MNKGMALRLRTVVATDSSLNAVVGLDTLTHFLPMVIESLRELRSYFASWLDGEPGVGPAPPDTPVDGGDL